MENQSSLLRKNDFKYIFLATLGFFFLGMGLIAQGVTKFNLAVLVAILATLVGAIVCTLSFYVPILVARKIISENNTVGRTMFGIFFGMLLFAVIVAIASVLFGTNIL